MTDDQKMNDKTGDPPATANMESLRAIIAEELGKLFSSGKADVVDHANNRKELAEGVVKDDVSIADEVRGELERLRGQETEANWKKQIESEVERVAKLAERSPLEVSKLTNWLWGEK